MLQCGILAHVLLKGSTQHHFTNLQRESISMFFAFIETLRLSPPVFVCVMSAAIRELAQQPARQLLRRRRRLRGDDCARERQVERRAVQLQPALRLQERNR